MIKVILELHIKEDEILPEYLGDLDKIKDVIQEDIQDDWRDDA